MRLYSPNYPSLFLALLGWIIWRLLMFEQSKKGPGNQTSWTASFMYVVRLFCFLALLDLDGRLTLIRAFELGRLSPSLRRFHLRWGLIFHSGEPTNADAAKFNCEHTSNPVKNMDKPWILSFFKQVKILNQFDVVTHNRLPDGLILNHLAVERRVG